MAPRSSYKLSCRGHFLVVVIFFVSVVESDADSPGINLDGHICQLEVSYPEYVDMVGGDQPAFLFTRVQDRLSVSQNEQGCRSADQNLCSTVSHNSHEVLELLAEPESATVSLG